ncbi:ankyrin repeat domain-containing protein [Wolbachia endosymbiont of Pentalonia nigronervosa]|jgi:ankyrin repeat protein|uniref:ankyrin repeat domain-containing protein n=1 Tax=Wolbachia endosymbiont of Pentalonia nigronervosa TaxID=1301914 RepID=UPI00165FFE7C|nr:ankyrin repeat domain-containing protein [Wolbachia endosymbiont of Pentalonia nigronervosa]MBD0390989.1 ankyrin repeat domain-containing protein [Wolbachia endosymbiont of Pentalonia nigronervosa]
MSLNDKLFSAVQAKDYDKVKSLIEQGAEVNATDSNGKTPLHYAASLSLDIVKYLVAQGADINARDNDEMTPLHDAARFHLDVVKYLVAQGADINARDNDYGYTPLYTPVFASDLDTVKYLVNNGANVKVTDNYGYTPLHNAVISATLEIVKCLVEKGANVNAKAGDGNTPLHWAVNSGNRKLETVQYLVNNGARVNIKNGHNKTPLDIIQEKCPKTCKEITDFLKEKRTNPRSRGIKQLTESTNSTIPSNRTQEQIRHKRQEEFVGTTTSSDLIQEQIRQERDILKNNVVPRVLTTESANSATIPALVLNAGHKEAPQLAHVQGGKAISQAGFNNTVPLNGTLLLFDTVVRMVTGETPVSFTTPIADLTQGQERLINALNNNSDFDGYMAAFHPNSRLENVSISSSNITRRL